MNRTRLLCSLLLLLLCAGCGGGPDAPGTGETAGAPASGSGEPSDEAPSAEPAPPAEPAPLGLEGWIARLADDETAGKAADHLATVRDEEYETLVKAWKEADAGPLKENLGRVLQVGELEQAGLVVRARGMGYFPKSHMSPIEGNCLVCAQGRLILDVQETWKGGPLFDEAQKVFALIGRLPGHAHHELPEVLGAKKGAGLAFVAVDRSGKSIDDIRSLDEKNRDREGVWLLRFPKDPVTVADMRDRGTIAPRFLLTWMAEGAFLPAEAGPRVRATLEAMKE